MLYANPFYKSDRTILSQFDRTIPSQINSNKGCFIIKSNKGHKMIEPEILFSQTSFLQQTFTYSLNLFDTFSSYVENLTREIIIFGLAEDISKCINAELKLKILEDKYLTKVLIKSIVKIKDYLKKSGKKYELNASVWHDMEDTDWEENIISVKIECKNNKEKRKIWDEIDKIVRNYEDDGVIILTQVDRYEL